MDELGKSIPAAEGMVDAEQSGTRKRYNEQCLNCGTTLLDTFCHHCGQKDLPKRQTLGELLSNFISSFWSYEGKFFRTTKFLITRPGYLAKEYTQGKRESFYHPARMYVFISFVFFLLAFSLPGNEEEDDIVEMGDGDAVEMSEQDRANMEEALKQVPPNPYFNDSALRKNLKAATDTTTRKKKKSANFSLSGSEYKSAREYDSLQQLKPESERDGWLVRKLELRNIELNNKYKDSGSFKDDFTQAFKDNFSKVLFYLLPFFALLLKLLYVRRYFFYSEHLVFSIYYYNFFYLGGSLFMLIDLVPVINDFTWLVGFWIYFYLLFAMKRMYQQNWAKTILKFAVFSFLFAILMTIGISISALLILLAL